MKALADQKKYFVACKETCMSCEGVGVVWSDSWRRWSEAHDKDESITPEKWATENGYCSVDEMGPEEIECDECSGTWMIKSEVPLQNALRELWRPEP